jgi:hypothetical protein
MKLQKELNLIGSYDIIETQKTSLLFCLKTNSRVIDVRESRLKKKKLYVDSSLAVYSV